jgi:hypothetical protein
MSKLYATLSSSAGKEVSISSNERIEATVYEGNKKQYSVYIEWCDIGDIVDNYGNELPESEKTKGSIITVKEWRNEPDERRERMENIVDKVNAKRIARGAKPIPKADRLGTCDCGYPCVYGTDHCERHQTP